MYHARTMFGSDRSRSEHGTILVQAWHNDGTKEARLNKKNPAGKRDKLIKYQKPKTLCLKEWMLHCLQPFLPALPPKKFISQVNYYISHCLSLRSAPGLEPGRALFRLPV